MHVTWLICNTTVGLTMTTDGKYTHSPRVYHVILFNTINSGQTCEAYHGCYNHVCRKVVAEPLKGDSQLVVSYQILFSLIGLPKCVYL